jgi:AcrR family transcriptional regulator
VAPYARFRHLDEPRRRSLIRAAADEFATKGYEAASVNRIAEQAGVSKGSVYYYFEDKVDLLATVLRELLGDLASLGGLQPASLTASGFWPELEGLVDRSLAAVHDEPALVGLGRIAYHPPDDPRVRRIIEREFAALRDALDGLIERGQQLRLIRRDAPLPLLRDMVTTVLEASDRWMVDHWKELSPEEADRLAAVILDMVRRLVAPPGPGPVPPEEHR